MTSQLTSLVPILDGTNYQEWSAKMTSFLMSQKQWKTIRGVSGYPPGTGPDPKTKGKTIITEQSLYDDWKDLKEQALGNIRLRLHFNIGYQFNEADDPKVLWEELKTRYGTPGITSAFVHFKAIMDTTIPPNADPNPAMDKIMSHDAQLRQMKWAIPEPILGMILLSKAPTTMESMVQLISTGLIDKDQEEVKVEKIQAAFRHSWETHSRQGTKGKGNQQNQQQSNKISAVHSGDGQPPQFNQQQQRGGGRGGGRGGRGKGRRGKRGSGNGQQQVQLADNQQQGPPQAGPSSQPQPYQPGPQGQWVQTPVQYPGQPNLTFFASSMQQGLPLPGSRPLPPTPPTYPSFNNALSLVHRLGLPATTETVKSLEQAEIAKAQSSSDPRPSKRPRTTTPRGEARGKSGKVKADDEVSLDWGSDEAGEDELMDDTMNYDGYANGDYNEDGEAEMLAGFQYEMQVQSSQRVEQNTNNTPLQLDSSSIAEVVIKSCCSCSHECDCEPDKSKEWIIDSGASMHFTYDLDDFIDYEVLPQVEFVKTANSSTHIFGKGTVILVLSTGEKLRIYPAFYVPDTVGIGVQSGSEYVWNMSGLG
jgi:hypothetical protein